MAFDIVLNITPTISEKVINTYRKLHDWNKLKDVSADSDLSQNILAAVTEIRKHFPEQPRDDADQEEYDKQIASFFIIVLQGFPFITNSEGQCLKGLLGRMPAGSEYRLLKGSDKAVDLIRQILKDFANNKLGELLSPNTVLPADGDYGFWLEAQEVLAHIPTYLREKDDFQVLQEYPIGGVLSFRDGEVIAKKEYPGNFCDGALNVIHVNHGCHWTTILVDLRDSSNPQVLHVDSMEGRHDIPHPILKKLQKQFPKYSEKIKPSSVALQMQIDGSTCGYWVGQVAENFYENRETNFASFKNSQGQVYHKILTALRARQKLLKEKFPDRKVEYPEDFIENITQQLPASQSSFKKDTDQSSSGSDAANPEGLQKEGETQLLNKNVDISTPTTSQLKKTYREKGGSWFRAGLIFGFLFLNPYEKVIEKLRNRSEKNADIAAKKVLQSHGLLKYKSRQDLVINSSQLTEQKSEEEKDYSCFKAPKLWLLSKIFGHSTFPKSPQCKPDEKGIVNLEYKSRRNKLPK